MIRLVLLTALLAGPAFAQTSLPTRPPDSPGSSVSADTRGRLRVALTVFRNPATGLELRLGRLSAHAGHYPTIVREGGGSRSLHFARFGVSAVLREEGATPYVSAAYAISLTSGWADSGLVEAGVRTPVWGRLEARLGGAVLVPTDGTRVRLNPTVGAAVAL